MFRTILDVFKITLYDSIKGAYEAYKLDNQTSFLSNFSKQIKKNYKNKFFNDSTEQDFKLSRARRLHIKKLIVEVAMFIAAFKLLMPLLYSVADDDKNKDKLLLQLAAYVGRRTQWETFTPYRLEDVQNSIKTVTAETSLFDKIQSFSSDLFSRYNLFSTFTNSGVDNDEIVKRGPYKGWPKFWKSAFKLFVPHHNLWEQVYGSKEKRRYYENQIMQIDK